MVICNEIVSPYAYILSMKIVLIFELIIQSHSNSLIRLVSVFAFYRRRENAQKMSKIRIKMPFQEQVKELIKILIIMDLVTLMTVIGYCRKWPMSENIESKYKCHYKPGKNSTNKNFFAAKKSSAFVGRLRERQLIRKNGKIQMRKYHLSKKRKHFTFHAFHTICRCL